MRFIRQGFLLFTLALGLLFQAGCVSPERVADRFTTAPNLQFHFMDQKSSAYLTRFLTNYHYQTFVIPVGPPAAELAAIDLAPSNYNIEFSGRVTEGAKGRKTFTLWMLPTTNEVTPVAPRGTIVLLHGYGTQKEAMLPWALILAQSGYRTVMVDLRGHGASTGREFTVGKYETVDLTQVLDFLIDHHLSDTNIGVLGYSLGANLALYWADRDPRVKTVVAIGAYDKPDEAMVRLAKELHLPVSQKKLRQAAAIVETKLQIHWADWDGSRAVSQLKKPLLLIGGGNDAVSPPADLRLLNQSSPPGSDFIFIPEASHETIGYWFSDLAQPVKTWFDQHLAVASLR